MKRGVTNVDMNMVSILKAVKCFALLINISRI